MMVSQTPQQPHSGITINWPVTLDGCLNPARGNINQYEFNCRDKNSIETKLPLIPGNLYVVTVSTVKGRRNKGVRVSCRFNQHTVLAQFHRHPKQGPKGIWIGSDFTNQRSVATQQWHKFVSLFGITVGKHSKTIPVYLDFHNDLLIVIRLRQPMSTTSK
jgi:hypothetical protein